MKKILSFLEKYHISLSIILGSVILSATLYYVILEATNAIRTTIFMFH